MFLGTGKFAKECSELTNDKTFAHKFYVVGYIQTSGETTVIPANELIRIMDNSLVATAKRHDVAEIIVSVDNRRAGNFPIKELLDCKLAGIKVTDATAFFEREASQIRVDSLQPSWLVFGSGFDQSLFRLSCKRAVDILMSAALFGALFPIMLITAILIVLEDHGPVFFRQERVGMNGKSFMVLKFRSMRNDAEKSGQPQWATSNDPRTTTVGRIIRKCRIDELPQIINVVRGDMSLVGTRPERPFFVNQIAEQVPFYNLRHSIKPGITGMAQVRYQYGASIDDATEKLQYDLYYVKNNSLFLDALILIETVQVVLFGKGAR